MSEKAYSEMEYAELQAAAKALDLPANGNKETLLARLEEHAAKNGSADGGEGDTGEEGGDAGNEGDTGEGEGEGEGDEGGDTGETDPEPTPKAKVTDREVEKQWRGDAMKMKAHLAKQKKVSIMIPLEVGVAPEVAEKIPFVVNMNGYRFQIKRGTFVEVPEQVAEMIKERLQSEGSIGREHRIDRDQSTLEALG